MKRLRQLFRIVLAGAIIAASFLVVAFALAIHGIWTIHESNSEAGRSLRRSATMTLEFINRDKNNDGQIVAKATVPWAQPKTPTLSFKGEKLHSSNSMLSERNKKGSFLDLNTGRRTTWQLPHSIALQFGANSRELANCLSRWEVQVSHGQGFSASELSLFENILTEASLEAGQCVTLLKATEKLEEETSGRDLPYPPVTGAIACQAIYAANDEIKENSDARDKAMATVSPLIQRLWFGPPRDAKAVGTYYAILANGAVAGSADYNRGMLGQTEAFIRQGRCGDAIVSANLILSKLSSGSPQDCGPVLYAKGLALFADNDFKQSIVALKEALPNINSDKQANAGALLVMAFSRIDHVADAQAEYGRLIASGSGTTLLEEAGYVLNAAARRQKTEPSDSLLSQ